MYEESISYEIAKLNEKYLKVYNTFVIFEERKKLGNIVKIVKKYGKGKRFKELFHMGARFVQRKKNLRNVETQTLGSHSFDDKLKVAVYTCVIGDYDELLEPVYRNKKCCDFFLFTDKNVTDTSQWEKVDINSINEIKNLDNRSKSRYIKTHPHLFFSDYDYSVWVDGNIRIMADVMPLIGEMGKAWFGVHNISNGIDCVYDNATSEIGGNKANREDVLRQIEYYKLEGYPQHNGLFETGILIREHNNPICIKVMDEWWDQMLNYCMRDQMSINYVMWSQNISKNEIYILGDNLYMNPRFFWQPHIENRK